MEFRWLTNDEIETLVNPKCSELGWVPLNINDLQPTCRVLGAFDGESLVGWIVLQLHPLLGPLYVRPDFRNGVLSSDLAERMHEFVREVGVRGVLAICESPVSERLAERHGMSRVKEPVYALVGGG